MVLDTDLDTMLSRVSVKCNNLQLEPAILQSNEENRAGCTREGVLVETPHARAMSYLLDLVRFMIGSVFMQSNDINDMRDIDRLRQQQQHGLMRLNQFMGMGWSHWLDSGGFVVPSKIDGVYGHIVEYLKEQVPKHNPGSVNDPVVQLMTKALDDISAVGGWHVRVHGNFWIVGEVDDKTLDKNGGNSGTYLIPDSNENMVFKVLGIRNHLFTLAKSTCPDYRPMKMVVTMVPWYGRLVYDGVVVPATNASGIPGPPIMASPSHTAKLKQTVIDAEERGCVIERLLELELQDSQSLLPDLTLLTIDDNNGQQQEEPTQMEKACLAKLAQYALPDSYANNSRRPKVFWTMRRFGYTEDDNPDHFGIVMNSGLPIGDFICTQGLAPISTDLLTSLIKVCADNNISSSSTTTNELLKLPMYLNIDDRACYNRMKYLFEKEDIFCNTKVLYYHPPSVEETDAATACGGSNGGGNSRSPRGGGRGYGQAA